MTKKQFYYCGEVWTKLLHRKKELEKKIKELSEELENVKKEFEKIDKVYSSMEPTEDLIFPFPIDN